MNEPLDENDRDRLGPYVDVLLQRVREHNWISAVNWVSSIEDAFPGVAHTENRAWKWVTDVIKNWRDYRASGQQSALPREAGAAKMVLEYIQEWKKEVLALEPVEDCNNE